MAFWSYDHLLEYFKSAKDNKMMIQKFILALSSLGLMMFVLPAYPAECQGCLCPGDPCNLCPLPAMKDAPIKDNEPDLCKRIRQQVPPTDAQPGSNEYFPSFDRSVAVCVREGGDVIRNRKQTAEFPARAYCKPPTILKKE